MRPANIGNTHNGRTGILRARYSALEHNVEFFDFTHFDFLETPLEGPLFFYAWKTSFCFIAGDDSIDLLFPQDSLVSLSTAILL